MVADGGGGCAFAAACQNAIRLRFVSDHLDELLDAVCDERTLLIYIDALAIDWEHGARADAADRPSPYGPGANGWENGTIGSFLEAGAAWARDAAHLVRSKEANPWQHFAQMLRAGKHYE